MFNTESANDYGESVNDYGELTDAYIPTGGSALESADSEQESADSNDGSNDNPPRIGVWVWAFTMCIKPYSCNAPLTTAYLQWCTCDANFHSMFNSNNHIITHEVSYESLYNPGINSVNCLKIRWKLAELSNNGVAVWPMLLRRPHSLLRLPLCRFDSRPQQRKWTLGGPLHRRCPNDPRQDMSGRPAHDS